MNLLQKKIAILQEQGLYNICFRNAGVGLMFHEEERANKWMATNFRPRPSSLAISEVGESIARQTERSRAHTEAGLVVYHYYPTLTKAVDAEMKRLFGEEAKERLAAFAG